MLKIEAGKYYRTRDGRKVGPVCISSMTDQYPFSGRVMGGMQWLGWTNSGCYNSVGSHPLDIISEWQDEETTGPVRTVTRKEIVRGDYGAVHVIGVDEKVVQISFYNDHDLRTWFTAQELREAAKVLNELASALEENASA